MAQFRVKEAYPIFIDILRLSGEMTHDIFGDTVCGTVGRILASICDDNTESIKELIEDSEVDEYVRGEGLRALTISALNNKLVREEVLEYYRELLNGGLKDQHPYIMTDIVCNCDDLYPEEVYEDIKQAFDKDLIEYGVIVIEDIQRTLKSKKEDVLIRSKNDIHLMLIDDTIKELEWWACFNKDKQQREWTALNNKVLKSNPIDTNTIVKNVKIGRNDPCPCGSGKKYKKCCGKNV